MGQLSDSAMAKLQRNLLILFTAAAMLFLALALAIAVNLGLERDNRILARESAERLQAIETLSTILYRAESSHRAYAASGAEMFAEDYQSLLGQLDAQLTTLAGMRFVEDREAALAARLAELVTARIDAMEALMAARREQGAEAAARFLASGSGRQLMEAIRTAVRELQDIEGALLAEREHSADLQGQWLSYLMATGLVLNLLLLAGAFAAVRREMKVNSKLMDQLRRHTDEISTINQLTSSLQSCQAREETADVLRHFLTLLFPGTSGGLYVMHASRNLLSLAVSWGDGDSLVDPIKPQDCWGLRLGRSHTLGISSTDMACGHLEAGTHASLCVPMMAQSDIVALLHIRFADAGGIPQAQRLAELLATHTASALASIVLREALHQQSIRDPLTQLFNRRYLEESIEREMLRSRRNNSPFSVIMLDIDHFKRFNDTHGHQAGDLLLREFAGLVRHQVRGEDIACRYGGEEFLLLIPGANAEQARQRAETIRQNLSSLELQFQGQSLPAVTASFGIAAFPEHGDDWDAVVRLADSALYRAKAEGRDRVVVAGDQEHGRMG